jgi:hypothetical protein
MICFEFTMFVSASQIARRAIYDRLFVPGTRECGVHQLSDNDAGCRVAAKPLALPIDREVASARLIR